MQGILGLISPVPFPEIHISTTLLKDWKCALDNKEYVAAILWAYLKLLIVFLTPFF